jgi:hypothetical protein
MLTAAGWVKFTSGPFEVLTDAGARQGRETLVRFEQFRHALGQVVGEQDLTSPRPVRILCFRNPKGWETSAALTDGRDSYGIVPPQNGDVPPGVFRALARLFLDSNTARMPAHFERGLVEFFSTISVSGIRITAGAPPANPDLDWARVHLLIVDPEYYGKLRVLLYNLRRGVAEDASYKNAFGATPAAIEERAKAHLAAGNFQTVSLPNRPMSERDFPERPVSDADARLARADLLGSRSSAEYEALIRDGVKVAESQEGLGLLALQSSRKDEALRRFSAAIEAGSSSARCFIEYARLESDREKASKALLRAAAINPKLDEPFAELARRDADPAQRLAHWKAAAERNPRNASYWQAIAEGYLAEHNYTEAAKAWSAGEQAAADPAERRRMRDARLAIEGQRLDYEASEKKRQDDEEARELENLKAEARAEVHSIERKYNDGAPKTTPNAVPWWGGPTPGGKITGMLKQVDCLGKQARLVVEGENRKTVRLLVSDPGKVAIDGPGEIALNCGSQKPRRVAIEYFPKADARLGTAGEVASIHFQ